MHRSGFDDAPSPMGHYGWSGGAFGGKGGLVWQRPGFLGFVLGGQPLFPEPYSRLQLNRDKFIPEVLKISVAAATKK